MIKKVAIFLSFAVGFLSLSQEILWVRLLGFLSHGAPYILSIVISCFLLGIAVGAVWGKRLCQSPRFKNTWLCGCWLMIGVTDIFIPHSFPWMMSSDFYLPLFVIMIFLTAAFKATIFPIVHHLFTSSDSAKVGSSLSYVYMANIIGSSLGPILTGFILLNFLSTFDVFHLIAIIGLAIALLMGLIFLRPRIGVMYGYCCSILLVVFLVTTTHQNTLVEVLQMANDEVVFISERREGIIHTIKGDADGDIVYGGNTYDGRMNFLLTKNTNKIDRVFLLSALKPKAEKVLVIGLSGGAWTKILTGNKNIKEIDVVEINPGYIDLIKANKDMASLLADERVSIYIDDGRRWLRNANLPNHYDLIVMNTTFHWRAYATNLLSREMLLLVKSSLVGDGLFTFNATGSKDAHETAASIFKESYRWSNFIYSSEQSFIKPPEELAAEVRKLYPLSSWPYEDMSTIDLETLFSNYEFISIEQERASMTRPLEVITDDNMIVEYRYGIR